MGKITLICHHCGKSYLKHQCYAERSKYCSRECVGAAIGGRQTAAALHTRICPICSTPYQTTNHHGGKKTCSRECGHALKGQKHMGHRDDKWVIKSCPHCGDEFGSWVYRNKKYCSDKCRGLAKTKEGTVIKPCATCGKPTEFIKAQIALRNGRYCSKECQHQAMSEEKKGSNNPNWTGGHEYPDWRGANWGRQCRKTRKRDNYTCQKCKTSFPKSSRYLHVHHIIPFRLFHPDYKTANQLDNLMCLCYQCHAWAETLTRAHERDNRLEIEHAPELMPTLRALIFDTPMDSNSD